MHGYSVVRPKGFDKPNLPVPNATTFWPLDTAPLAWNMMSGVSKGTWTKNTGSMRLAPTPGKALCTEFDGNTAVIAFTAAGSPFTGSTPSTVAAWALTRNVAQTGNPRIYSLVDAAGTAGQLAAVNPATSKLEMQYFGAGWASTSLITNNVWMHWVLTYNNVGPVFKMYLNGVDNVGATASPGLGFDTVSIIGGRDAVGTNSWIGSIARVMYWNNFIMSAAQVASLYADERTNFYGPPVQRLWPIGTPAARAAPAAAYFPYTRIRNYVRR